MRFTSTATADGVTERSFSLGDVPGVLWAPPEPLGTRPLVLLGHGGGQHKQAPGVVARAHRYVRECGFVAAAIDAPGHGARPRIARDERQISDLRERMAAGEPVGAEIARGNAERAARAVPEWRAALTALRDRGYAVGPVGYWGVALGSAIGIPLVATEPSIGAAVFGLVGPAGLVESATRVRVPVEFLLQWDDELVARDTGLALFDAFGSTEKTLHASPGRHTGVPRFEVESSERFFRRHLTTA